MKTIHAIAAARIATAGVGAAILSRVADLLRRTNRVVDLALWPLQDRDACPRDRQCPRDAPLAEPFFNRESE